MHILNRMVLWPLKLYARVAPTERGGYRLVRLARRFVPRADWTGVFIAPANLRIELDLGIYPDCCMAVGLYELDTLRQMRRLLHPGGWFVDCGANIGYLTMLAARRVGAGGRIDAFEPDPINRARLKRHLAENGLNAQVQVHPAAVSDRSGRMSLYHPRGAGHNHGMASAYSSMFAEADEYEVPVVRLDEQLTGVPDLIKLDVEGGELAALRGMRGLLQSPSPPRLIIEHNRVTAAAAGYAPSELFRLLQSIQPRYRVFWIGRKLHPVTSPERLDLLERQVNLLVEATDAGSTT